MAAVQLTNTWIQSQTKQIKAAYLRSTPEAPPLYQVWFNIWGNDARRSFLQYLSYIGFGYLSVKIESAAPAADQAMEGTPSMFPFFTMGLEYGLSLESLQEDPLNLNARLPRQLRFSEEQTKEVTFWNTLNQAFNANVPLWTGLSLCNANQPLQGPVTASTNTFSNTLGATALTPESLEQAFILMEVLPDDRGLATFKTPKMLLAPPGLHRQMEEVLGSAYYPYSAENRINVVKDKVEPLVVRYLNPAQGTGPFPWFVTAGKGELGDDAHSCFVSFKWQNRQTVYVDQRTNNIYHKTEFRSTFGGVDPRGIVGSQGA